jgi:hypothetical protein
MPPAVPERNTHRMGSAKAAAVPPQSKMRGTLGPQSKTRGRR